MPRPNLEKEVSTIIDPKTFDLKAIEFKLSRSSDGKHLNVYIDDPKLVPSLAMGIENVQSLINNLRDVIVRKSIEGCGDPTVTCYKIYLMAC